MSSNSKKDPRRVIFVLRYFHPFVGGMEKKALNLAVGLVRQGIAVEVVTGRFYRSWPRREQIQGVTVARIASPRIKVLGAAVFLVSLCIYLFKKRSHISLIHAFQVGYGSAAAVCMGKMLGRRTVLSLACSGSGGDVRRHMMSPWGICFLLLCRLASRIVVLNQEMFGELEKIRYERRHIVKIANGVDTSLYAPAKNRAALRLQMGIASEKIILYAGRLASPQKMLEELILSYAQLDPSLYAKLYIVGNGPDRSRLQGLAKKLVLDGCVSILPAVDTIVEFMQSADIFVLPSRFEGISNAVLEAMACGLPVIASRIAGNSELIRDGVTGLLVKPGDVQELARALTCLLASPEKAEKLGLSARQAVLKSYDVSGSIEKYMALYTGLLS